MRIPDPKANTTTEAYLAYKAGYLEESELKPVLYEPYLHFDGWLAYWAGLTATYPVKNVGKNLINNYSPDVIASTASWTPTATGGNISNSATWGDGVQWRPTVVAGQEYTFHAEITQGSCFFYIRTYTDSSYTTMSSSYLGDASGTITKSFVPDTQYLYIRIAHNAAMNNVPVNNLQLEKGASYTGYEPYSGEPEMLCDEEALVAYLSGVTDTYPEEIKDPYDVRIVGYLKHLASIRWPEPDYPVNNEEFYLSTMEPTHTSNPEPSSDIELDTAEGKIINVEAYGDTYQQTYSGKNLWDFNGLPNKNYMGSNLTINEVFESGAIVTGDTSTSTVDSANSKGWFAPAVLGNNAPKRIPLNNGDTFTISADVTIIETGYSNTIYIGRYLGAVNQGLGQGNTLTVGVKTRISATFTASASGDYSPYITLSSCKVKIENIQFEKSSTATSYEPYTGGIPAPNPDYPQDIQVVTGEQTVKITGKNLFPLGTGSYTAHGLTSVYNADGSITVSGTADAIYADLTTNRLVNYEQGKTYTVSITEALPCSFGLITLGSGTHREDIAINVGIKSGKRTLSYTHNIAKLYIYNLTVGQSYNFTVYPMVEEGSTATTYQPYQSQSYTIDLGSIELCKIGDYQDYIYNSSDDWYVHKATGKIIVDGSYGGYNSTFEWYYCSAAQYGGDTPSSTALCVGNLFRYIPFATFRANTSLDGVSVENGGIRMRNTACTSASNYQTWLSNNNLILYYQLATPTDTKITDATLVGQLDALAGADTYNEKTHIKVTATDPNLPALLKVEAYKY